MSRQGPGNYYRTPRSSSTVMYQPAICVVPKLDAADHLSHSQAPVGIRIPMMNFYYITFTGIMIQSRMSHTNTISRRLTPPKIRRAGSGFLRSPSSNCLRNINLASTFAPPPQMRLRHSSSSAHPLHIFSSSSDAFNSSILPAWTKASLSGE